MFAICLGFEKIQFQYYPTVMNSKTIDLSASQASFSLLILFPSYLKIKNDASTLDWDVRSFPFLQRDDPP